MKRRLEPKDLMMTDQAGRKFASADEAFEFILAAGECPEAWDIALTWGWDWDQDIKPSLPQLKRRSLSDPAATAAKVNPAPASAPGQKPKARVVEIPPAPEAPEGTGEVDKLFYPPGLLGHATQYIMDTSRLPHRVIALSAALSGLAKLIDRKVLGPEDCSTILWTLLVAETGAGKQPALNCVRQIQKACGMEDAIVASGLASVQAVEEILEGNVREGIDPKPSALLEVDEIGALFSRIVKSGKSNMGNISEIPGLLQSLWGWPPELVWRGTKKKGKHMVDVYGPALAIFGASTERKLFRNFTSNQISNGFVNRFVFFNAGRGCEEAVRPVYKWTQIPTWLRKALKAVAGEPSKAGPIRVDVIDPETGEQVTVKDFRRVGWGEGAFEVWHKYETEIRGMPSADRELWIRAPENALRIATVLAVFCGSEVVEVSHLRWAIGVAEYSMKILKRGLGKHFQDDLDQAEIVERLREAFRGTKPDKDGDRVLTIGVVRKLCERLTNDYRKIDVAIGHLERVGDIELVDRRGKVGKPTDRWRWVEE